MFSLINMPAYKPSPILDLAPVAMALKERQRAYEATQERALRERQAQVDEERFGLQKRDSDLSYANASAQKAAYDDLMKQNPEFISRSPELSSALRVGGYKAAPDMIMGAQNSDLKRSQLEGQVNLNKAHADLYAAQAAEHRSTSQGGGKRSLVPVYGQDESGNTVLLQTGPDGTAVQTQLPSGVKVSSGIEKVDLGQEWALYDKKSGTFLKTVPKDIAGKEAAEEVGKARGKAQVDLPRILDNANSMISLIDMIDKHPSKGLAIGVGGIVPGIPGTGQRDFIGLVDQARGKAFLEAFNSLRGGGAITEAEGAKATQSIARLDRAQSREGWQQALKDLRAVVETGRERARQMAGVPQGGGLQSAGPSQSIPRVQSVEDAMKLPKGTRFVDPSGVIREVP